MFVTLLFLWLAMPLPAQRPEPVCPLTEEQTQKSIDAFAELAPIFREPRCINCHGAVNPFDPNNGEHEGGNFPPQDRDATDDQGQPKVKCYSCHDAFKKWELAPDPMFFVGKDDEALCEQMKEMFTRAQTGPVSFMGHMKKDNEGTQFIEVAFLGNRGMTEETLKPDTDEPPPGWTHEKMIQLAQKWVDAQGGRFHGDPSCGCKKKHYALQLDYKQILNIDFGVLTGQYSTTTTGAQNSNGLEIPLAVRELGVFKGEGVMKLGGSGYVNSPVGGCLGQGQQSFMVHATAQMEEGDELSQGEKNKLHVKLTCDKIHSQFNGACPHATGSDDTYNPCNANVSVDFAPANVHASESQAFPTPVPNSQSTLTSTIVKK